VTATTNSITANSVSAKYLTNTQAFTSAVFCLLLGIGGGYLIRRAQSHSLPSQATAAASPAPGSAASAPAPGQLKGIAEAQVAVKLEQLKSDPNNVALLNDVGNIYYDSKQYPAAIDYYNRSLKLQPNDTAVRTDLATAYWYVGDADTAIAEFNKALAYEPTKPDTLFNLGIVKWQGKRDAAGAVAAWQKLLDTNPAYDNKDKVLALIAQTKK
jgi:cytochrome c-type biogenesis protein CcmH/NrfG